MAKVRERLIHPDYLNVQPTGIEKIVLLGKGFETIDENPGAATDDTTYYNEKSTTTEITEYKSNFDFTGKRIIGEPGCDYIYDIGQMHRIDEAVTQLYEVDLDMPAEIGSGTKFHCRKFEVLTTVDSLKANNKKDSFSGKFNGRGDPIEGVFDTSKVGTSENPFTAGWTKPTLGTLTVTSIAGTATGDTKLTVAPTLTEGNSYRYQTGTTVTLPIVGADCTAMTAWDGTVDITATTGNQIMVVETTATGLAVKAGIATVTAKA
ncbi:MAG: hypothetical protein PHE09_20075 [Oscillospiraceae bacterium]|nr:hypothetical protein [Oscillospiraceae bacterium]